MAIKNGIPESQKDILFLALCYAEYERCKAVREHTDPKEKKVAAKLAQIFRRTRHLKFGILLRENDPMFLSGVKEEEIASAIESA